MRELLICGARAEGGEEQVYLCAWVHVCLNIFFSLLFFSRQIKIDSRHAAPANEAELLLGVSNTKNNN